METGKAKAEAAAAAAPQKAKKSLKKPSLNFNAIFKKPNKNAKSDAEQNAQAGDAAAAPGDQTHPRDSEETVVITDEIPEKKVSSRGSGGRRDPRIQCL